jgi:hypothetical protein
MKNTEIDLAQSFEKVLATVLSLPPGCTPAVMDRFSDEADLKPVIRDLYEAANGRQVETNIGLIMIAPPAYAFLKAKPFSVTTQTEFLIEAAGRLIAGPTAADNREKMAEAVVDDKTRYKTSIHSRPTYRTSLPLMLKLNVDALLREAPVFSANNR